jgi:hypothetical protein
MVTKSPYLKPSRLADVLAAIQSMALYERSSGKSDFWAECIAGEKGEEAYWESVFSDHPEFFRLSPEKDGRYALIWRRALPRRFDRRLMRQLNETEYAKISDDEKKFISRPPISEEQVKTLIDVAIALHAKALEQSRDYRWWLGQIFTLIVSASGAMVGAILGARK